MSAKNEWISQIKNHLDMINQEMEKCKKSLQIAPNNVGDDAQLLNSDMQNKIQDMQRAVESLSDVLKSNNDAVNAILKNMTA